MTKTKEKKYANHGLYHCDGGSLAVYSGKTCFKIGNDVGDGKYGWRVGKSGSKHKFITCIYFSDDTYISGYDCDIVDPVQIEPGRYGVYNDKDGNILFEMWDRDEWEKIK